MDESHFVDRELFKNSVVSPSGKREQSNTDIDFFKFVINAIKSGYIGFGDVLVMDNAKVHTSDCSFEYLVEALSRAGARVAFLPAYSPELNPCEEIFRDTKRWIRYQRYPFQDSTVCKGNRRVNQR